MEPTVRVGDVVTIRSGDTRIGDVVLFEHVRGTLGLHRVIARLPGGWVIHCGDEPSSRPGATRVERVIGRADRLRRRPRVWQLRRAAVFVARRALRS